MIVFIVGLVAVLLPLFYGAWKIAIGIAIGFIVLSLLPLEGYTERKHKKTIHLLKLRRNGPKDSCYYVEVRGNKAILAYDNSDMYNLDGYAYEELCVRGKIIVYESPNCEKPIMKKYIIKPSRVVLAIALFCTKHEYVFYVPEGTVLDSKNKQSKVKVPYTDIV
ncbi:MAG: hypothetical protein IJ272_09280 [Clostridia bacterium]|nr:hypothetical protein [Clostridia bacterium]